jgi:membrane-bound lytic murein transglycosylase MltF
MRCLITSLLVFIHPNTSKTANVLGGKASRAVCLCLAMLTGLAWQGQALAINSQNAQTLAQAQWTGDLDGMIERRMIRALVPYNKTLYFIDKGAAQHGIAHDLMVEFEKRINQEHHERHKKIYVVFVPTPRDRLIDDLVAGKGDIIAANLTQTPARAKRVNFVRPLADNVSEVVVTGPKDPNIDTLDDLSGQSVYVNPDMSYAASLKQLNRDFTKRGLAPVDIVPLPTDFETEDALEMVQAGLVGISIADDYLADFWGEVFPKLKVHHTLSVRHGGKVGFAVRKDSPQLAKALNRFLAKYGQGSLFGNTTLNKYLKSVHWAKRATDAGDIDKAVRHASAFQTYAQKYDLDWQLMLAQGFQESGLNQNAQSAVGAIGVMQLMPSTGKQLKVGDIHKAENNIHGGVKYMRELIDNHFADEGMDPIEQSMFALAAYNAGPSRIDRLRKKAKEKGLDPNKWFNNVELVVAEDVGRQTTQYVSNIYKYYVAFSLLNDPVFDIDSKQQAVSDQLRQEQTAREDPKDD